MCANVLCAVHECSTTVCVLCVWLCMICVSGIVMSVRAKERFGRYDLS